MSLYKEYVQLGDQTIKFSISFNKNTTNWATSQPKQIGYQVTALPVKITQHEGYSIEESVAFTGFNACLLPVGRQSAKRLEEAKKILQEKKEQLLNYFK